MKPKKDTKQLLFENMAKINPELKLTKNGLRLNEFYRRPHSTYGQEGDPRVITLKRDGVCAETGKTIKAGEQAVYYPRNKEIFCMDSNQAKEFRDWKADMDMGYDY